MRRKPSQDRSKQLVSDILEAGAQVFGELGYEAASTNKIARRAGVSIGSIYQYFADKDALIGALIEDRTRKLDHLIMETFLANMEYPYPVASEACLRAGIEFYEAEPGLMRVLLDKRQTLGDQFTFQLNEMKSVQASKTYLMRHENDLDIEDFDVAAFICVNTARSYSSRIALQSPENLDKERLIKAVVKMLCGYVGAVAEKPRPANSTK